METRVGTLLVMTATEGRGSGDTARCAQVPVPVDGDCLDESLRASGHIEEDGSADDASSSRG